MIKPLSEKQMRNVLRRACERAGSQNEWGKRNGFTGAAVSYMVNGQRAISERAAAALGFVPLTTICYRHMTRDEVLQAKSKGD